MDRMQDTTTAQHPIVGTWRWVSNPAKPPDAYAIFHADGTYIETGLFAGVVIGAWRATGERSVDVTMSFQDVDVSVAGVTPGMGTLWLAAEVDRTGNAMILRGSAELRSIENDVMFQGGGFEFRGTRMMVEPVPDFPPPPPGSPSLPGAPST